MDNLETLSIVSFAATVLSLVAVVIVFVLYTFVPQIRSNLFFRLGFHISLSDFIFGLSSAYLKAPEDPSYLCQSLGGIREFAWLGSILWTTILTRNMYHFVRHSTSEEELSDKRTYYVILGYFPSLIVSLAPVFIVKGLYGTSGPYCWISDNVKDSFNIVSLMLYLPLAFGLILCIIWCLMASTNLRLLLGRKTSREFLSLLYYPLMLALCNSGVLADGLYRQYINAEGIIALQYYAVIMRQLQGFLNAMVFILNRQVRRAVRRRVKKSESAEHIDDRGSYAVSFIRNLEELQTDNHEELVAKYFNTKGSVIMNT